MKIILMENVNSLGNVGEIVNVSPGYARNFLFPKGLAKFADEKNKRVLENQKRSLTKKIEKQRVQARQIKEKLDGLKIELVKRVGANGKLFGMVTSAEISRELVKSEVNIERRLLVIKTPIKMAGTFTVEAKIFQDIISEFQVTVKMSAKQLEELKKKSQGKAQDSDQGKEEADSVRANESDEEATSLEPEGVTSDEFSHDEDIEKKSMEVETE